MNADGLGADSVKQTLATICKYEGDLRKAEKELDLHLQRKRAEVQANAPSAVPGPTPPGKDKDLLH
jgi:hypothetical protein